MVERAVDAVGVRDNVHALVEVGDRVLEQFQSIAMFWQFLHASPVRMVGRKQKPFGMGHQSKHAS